MAQMMFPDIGGNSLAALYRGEARGKQSRLAQLASQAYSTPTQDRGALLGQMAGVDPQAAASAQQNMAKWDDQKHEALIRSAQMLLAAPEEARPQVWQQIVSAGEIPGLKPQYDPIAVPEMAKKIVAMGGNDVNARVQSTYVDDQGNRVAIMRDGSKQILGQNAPNNQIIDTGAGYFGVNKSNLNAAPVMTGGRPQPQAPATTFTGADGAPVQIDPNLPPDVQASIRGNEGQWAQAPDQSQANIGPQPGGQLRSQPKPISPAQQATLDLQRERMRIAQEARDQAAAARKAADEAKAAQKQQIADARQAESATAANDLVGAIDSLMQAPGFQDLGTVTGDFKINTPLIRSDAKDAQAQLKNIAGQVALSTMARLKALSAQGATGFGALSAPELKLLENSIAALRSEDISNPQLVKSLKIVRDKMAKISEWKGSQKNGDVPASNDISDLLSKYGAK